MDSIIYRLYRCYSRRVFGGEASIGESIDAQKRIQLLSWFSILATFTGLAIAATTLILSYAFSFPFINQAIGQTIISAFYLIPFFLSRKGHSISGKILFLLILNLNILFFNFINDERFGNHVLFIAASISSYLIFSPEEKRYRNRLSLVSFLFLGLSVLIFGIYDFPTDPFNQFLFIYRNFIILIIALAAFLVTHFLYHANLRSEEKLKLERMKTDQLLLNILPETIAAELKQNGKSEPVHFDCATIMFIDFKGFTQIAENLTPRELVTELDACFTQFDKITERYKLEKLKTIGDAYMCAGGIPKINATHAIDCCLAAMEIRAFMNQVKEIKQGLGVPYWELRLGIHSGALMAGVVGEKKFAYDVWGDTVNTASRMESSGTVGKINLSSVTFDLVKDYFECEYRGEVEAKNKGKMKMYYLNRIKPEYAKDADGFIPNDAFRRIYENIATKA